MLAVLGVVALAFGYLLPESLTTNVHAGDVLVPLPTTGPYALLAGKNPKELGLFSYHWVQIPAREAIAILEADARISLQMPVCVDRPISFDARCVRPIAALMVIRRQLRCNCGSLDGRPLVIIPYGVPPAPSVPRPGRLTGCTLPIPLEFLQADDRLASLVRTVYLGLVTVRPVKDRDFDALDCSRNSGKLLLRDLKNFIQALDVPSAGTPTPPFPSGAP